MYLKEIHENSAESKLNRAEVNPNVPVYIFPHLNQIHIFVLLSA